MLEERRWRVRARKRRDGRVDSRKTKSCLMARLPALGMWRRYRRTHMATLFRPWNRRTQTKKVCHESTSAKSDDVSHVSHCLSAVTERSIESKATHKRYLTIQRHRSIYTMQSYQPRRSRMLLTLAPLPIQLPTSASSAIFSRPLYVGMRISTDRSMKTCTPGYPTCCASECWTTGAP